MAVVAHTTDMRYADTASTYMRYDASTYMGYTNASSTYMGYTNASSTYRDTPMPPPAMAANACSFPSRGPVANSDVTAMTNVLNAVFVFDV
jgi:hypothetical protein